jgi:NAD(P)-dependent dehydrogenase (short-subunit alcohol dehydrogenase family)
MARVHTSSGTTTGTRRDHPRAVPQLAPVRGCCAGVLMSALSKQVVLVIGGSSGIGFEIARQAAEQGADLIVAGRDASKVSAAAARLGGGAHAQIVDAHDDAELAGLFSTLKDLHTELGSSRLIPIDHVVSMVGDSMSGGFLSTLPETMRHVLHSKFWTNWMIGRYSAPVLRDGGTITFTAGTGGRPHETSASYVANLGIEALVQGLACELAPRIRINAVAPTFMGTATSFWRDMPVADLLQAEVGFAGDVPLERTATVEEVASTYLHLMTNTFITGQVIAVDGGVMLHK